MNYIEEKVDAQCPKHTIPACYPCSTYAVLLGQDLELQRVLKVIEGMKGILSHDNIQEHTRRITRHNTLDEITQALTAKEA